MWACPTCKRADRIDICADVWVRLVQPAGDPEAFETHEDRAEDQGHAWDGNHGAVCHGCGFSGNLDEFNAEDWEIVCDAVCATCAKAYASKDDDEAELELCPECTADALASPADEVGV